MIPWTIRGPDGSAPIQTYNAEVSRAMAACLPIGFLHRARLLGHAGLMGTLPEQVVRGRLRELGRSYTILRRLRRRLNRWFQWDFDATPRDR